MCGIFAIIQSKCMTAQQVRQRCLFNSRLLRHRGPDWSGVWVSPDGTTALGHERLAIVDPVSGEQPLLSADGKIALCVNGEIYNHQQHRDHYKSYPFKTDSDCEVIIPLYLEFGSKCVDYLDGMFAFVLYDVEKGTVLSARDPMGICPMYIGKHADGSTWFASEAKALQNDCATIEWFAPGCKFTSSSGVERYYSPTWWGESVPTKSAELSKIRSLFIDSVEKRMMADVPFGVLLSGGLDSSLVASVAARALRRDGESKFSFPTLHSFCIGLPGSPDIIAAQKVAESIGTKHHSLTFTVQDGLDALRDVIYKLETYDVTTIRASTPMYFLARKIKSLGVKMVLSGEGADELFGGYLYFHNAPSSDDFHKECCRRVKKLHLFDNLRANKSTMAWGLEVRVPFLDKQFVEHVMEINPKEKQPSRKEKKIEKAILRQAFDDPVTPYLPKSVLWRQKEQFSDGVGYSWIDGVRDYATMQVTDEMFSQASTLYPVNTPATKEAFYYRQVFDELFHHASMPHTVECWVPKWSNTSDPSGRAIKEVHDAAYTGSMAKL
eukprot:TRINITY_DN436_c10_g1_i1.p1 TRINITY_DN436_c10_g1~~TRINITY_DN436_c10_g1_i1.p1  ORF type:complete len:575 (+),score=130.91 TRINITY_DN436_c10_g1_i1:75-1727(+)